MIKSSGIFYPQRPRHVFASLIAVFPNNKQTQFFLETGYYVKCVGLTPIIPPTISLSLHLSLQFKSIFSLSLHNDYNDRGSDGSRWRIRLGPRRWIQFFLRLIGQFSTSTFLVNSPAYISDNSPRTYSPPAFSNCLPTACPRLPIACRAGWPSRPSGSKETRNVVGKIDEKREDQFAEDSPRDERLRSLDRDHAGILHHPIPARYPESREGAGGNFRWAIAERSWAIAEQS